MAYIGNKRIIATVHETFGVEKIIDEILTLQNSLIPKKPMFTIDDNGTISTYEFEEGMTWGEWCNSKYNTIEAFVNEDEGFAIYAGIGQLQLDGYEIYEYETIQADATYYLLKPMITFTVRYAGDPTTYQCEEGMTWDEWCNSEYNTDGFYVDESGYVYKGVTCIHNDAYYPMGVDTIIADFEYRT